MFNNITVDGFRREFKAYGRDDNFSYAGLGALFEYLEESESDIGKGVELDVIALCCDFCEYGNIDDCLKEYTLSSIDELRDNTTVIEFGESVIIQMY